MILACPQCGKMRIDPEILPNSDYYFVQCGGCRFNAQRGQWKELPTVSNEIVLEQLPYATVKQQRRAGDTQYMVYYPPGMTDTGAGQISNNEIAKALLCNLESGGHGSLPSGEGWSVYYRIGSGEWKELGKS